MCEQVLWITGAYAMTVKHMTSLETQNLLLCLTSCSPTEFLELYRMRICDLQASADST